VANAAAQRRERRPRDKETRRGGDKEIGIGSVSLSPCLLVSLAIGGRWSVVGGRAIALGQHPADEAAVLLFQRAEAGKCRQQTLALRLGVMNAGQQRLADLVKRLRAEAAADEIGERLVRAVAPRRDEEVHRHTQLAPRR